MNQMRGWSWRRGVGNGAAGVAALAIIAGFVLDGGRGREAQAEVADPVERAPLVEAPSPSPEPPREPAPDPRLGFDLTALVEREGRLVQELDGRTIVTTLDPELQRFAEELLASFDVPDGAAVAIDSRTGEVLALAEHSTRAPGSHVALSAAPPAASIFKIVTAAALLEAAGLSPSLEACYHGGEGGISDALLQPDAERDTACATMAQALGRSINVIFARLADQHLTGAQLEGYARGFGFNAPIAFDLPLEQSRFELPADRLERARAAAGFWHSNLSPLQAAVMAQAVAQGGAMLRPYVIDEVLDGEGAVIYDGEPAYVGNVCTAATARQLARMMVVTTTVGTARSSFRDRAGTPVIAGVDVAGKTGTLHGQAPFRAYDWFMGFAPAGAPEIAVAGLVINDPRWRIKGHYVGRELLRRYFQLRRARAASASADQGAP
jgi:cell division protein FtsI/penicillin-binding protein 2